MKVPARIIAASVLAFFLSPLVVSASGQGSGVVALEGQLVDSACALEAGSLHQVVTMEAVSIGQLIRQGESTPHPFSLRLVNCSLSRPDPSRPGNYLPDWQHVRVTFEGQAGASGRTFATQGTSQGLAYQINDKQGHESAPGMPMPLIPLTGKDQELHYTLQLVGNGLPMAVGSHRAAVRFRLEYF